MKRYRRTVMVASLLMAPAIPRAADATPQRLITVLGEGEVRIVPDRAVFSFTIETNDKDLQTAKRENELRSRKLLVAVKTMRIDPKDIQTDQLQVEPRYQGYPNREFLGYFVRNGMTVTVRDLGRFESIYDAALVAGAEYVNGVRFETSKLADCQARAREAALLEAREKGKAMAHTLGQSIGKPVAIQEGARQSPLPAAMMANSSMRVANEAEGPAVALGQLVVTVNVTVVFELTD